MVLGVKEVDYGSSFWDDYQWGGPEPHEMVDEPDYVDGFLWSCCKEGLGEEGCRMSRHVSEREMPLDGSKNHGNKKRRHS